jgi:hypothetical protein
VRSTFAANAIALLAAFGICACAGAADLHPIVVRTPKSKKVLHKFTWNGEKFQKDK